MKIRDRFDKAIEYLVEKNHYLAAETTKLGFPALSNLIPTAGVVWDTQRNKACFLFNEKFAEILTDEEFAFVVAHESIHLLNCHVFLLRDEIEKMKKLNRTNQEIFKFKMKLNIAADCVVNDSLINLYNLPKVLDVESETKPKIIYGQDKIQRDCQDLTAMDVYYLLPDDPQGEVENHLWDSFFNNDGTLKKEYVDSVKKFVEDNMENSSLSDKEFSQIEDIKKTMQDSTDPQAAYAGKNITSSFRPVDGLSRKSINWNKILYQFVETLRPEDIWTKPNRKLVEFSKDIVLPSSRDKEKEKIFVAIDSSGSIDYDALNLFISVVKNTPKRFEIEAISFDHATYPYNIKGSARPQGGGGTNFQIIEDYIKNNLKKYPKAIFVLTDGVGTPIAPKHPERWCWLLYGVASTAYCSKMKNYHINDLLRNT